MVPFSIIRYFVVFIAKNVSDLWLLLFLFTHCFVLATESILETNQLHPVYLFCFQKMGNRDLPVVCDWDF